MCKSRATCVPLQYPSSATRGVKQGLNSNKKPSKQNLPVVSTLLQERNNNTTDDVHSEPSIKETLFTPPVSKTESGMYYELSNKRRMECERYQDCSWFQQGSIKEGLNTKLPLVETDEAVINTNELDLAMHMQFANAHTIPWGDEYLEVFDDDILLEVNDDIGEKNKNILSPSNENISNANLKTGEDSVYNTSNFNYSLRKTDSFDSMKNISSTNPAEIIPISYKEKLINSNYDLTKINNIKSEVNEEVEVYSPESGMFLLDSDDTDLNIGREEIVMEGNLNGDQPEANKKGHFETDAKGFSGIPYKSDMLSVKAVVSDSKIVGGDVMKFEIPSAPVENQVIALPIKMECNDNKKEICDEKLGLNLDLTKGNFEQSVVDVNTPDLDFMDLVDFINEEMHPAHENTAVVSSFQNIKSEVDSSSTQNISSQKSQGPTKAVESLIPSQTTPASDRSVLKSSSDLSSINCKNNSTVNLNDISEKCISIAERIKTGAKRRTPKKYEYRDIDVSEDENYDDFASEDEDDDDYDYKEDLDRRREPIRKRSKSTTSESSSSSKRQKSDFNEVDSYRERRDKNNEASRRSRQNRKDREMQMFKTLEEEERRNVKLKAEAEVLEKQVTSLRQLLLQVVLRKGGPT